MHVVATAGHVDHGKSALVTALTGTEPDRLEEERRRGLSIQLGYAWTTLPGAGKVAFVDVPGHERFITTTLAGLGPVPSVLFVVAADDPWMPQAAEHLAALDALGVEHGVLAVTRADLADPAPARARALAELGATSLRGVRAVAVSARTGDGLDELRRALGDMVAGLPQPSPEEPVRLWVDRSFTMTGAGAVVTGTLPAGRVGAGDRLRSAHGEHRVREVQSLGRPVGVATGVARVALNLSGDVERSDVLVTPGAWHHTEVLDVRLGPARLGTGEPPQRPLLHIGSAVLAAHHRPLGEGLSRLTVGRPLPLRVGDRALLRDPGTRRLWAVTVLDPAPPPLGRRGAARARARALAGADGRADLAAELDRRGVVSAALLTRIGVPAGDLPDGVVAAEDWLLSPARAAEAARAAEDVVRGHASSAPLEPPLTLAALAERLGLPGPEVVAAVVVPSLRVEAGRVRLPDADAVPADVLTAVGALRGRLAPDPFAAPGADELAALGLDAKVQAAAVRAGLLLRPAPGVLLLAGADDLAVERLGGLPQPFTVSEARQHLGTSRRVVLPLLAHLDRTGRTRRLPDDRRRLTGR
ncbi:SelB C-terminal domain-containing protein [Georgenia sp. H159]|uniref:SelB domain-containing protein n=1 Tax=Georgenia sp. H159 TaxID=3076115 RepID=UPI002D766D20|nr:SelB C-terminal domain-containing protein [Georgenia sp. H159]